MNIYFINTFTEKLFSGNPAAVIMLKEWLSDEILQEISVENNLPATVFLLHKNNKYHIRWFTPDYELNLCGHGTLAAAYVVFNKIEPELQEIDFHSRSELIKAKRKNDIIFLDFPVKNIESCQSITLLTQGLGIEPKQVYQSNMERCLAIFETEEDIRKLKPDMQLLQQLIYRGIDVTAPGRHVDFVSRTFYPKKIITEDPVCGAAHCLLIPYWAKQLNKTNLHAWQASKRGGELFCFYQNNRVLIGGRSVLYMQGTVVSPKS